MKHALLYARVSTDDQAEEGYSIPAQVEKLKAYALIQGWSWELFVDDGCSGKDLNRPDMQKILDKVRQKKAEYVVVIKLDRLSRRQKDILYLIEDEFEPNGVSFVSVTESFDTSTPFGKAALGMMAVFAQLERETIVQRSRDGKAQVAKQGRWHGGLQPFGYRYSDKAKSEIVPDEATAHWVPQIFERYLNSYGYQSIADWLAENDVPTVKGAKWASTTVRVILTNPVYIGKIRYKGQVLDGKHKPLISEQLWQAVQKEIARRDSRAQSTTKRKNSLLPGIVFCDQCGARMRTKNVMQTYPKPGRLIGYYVCYSQDGGSKHMIKDEKCKIGYKHVEDIDRQVIEKLMAYSVDESLLNAVITEELNRQPDERKELLTRKEALQKELINIKSRINRWYDAFENGQMESNDPEVRERVNKLRDRRIKIEQEIMDMNEILSNEIDKETSIQQLKTMVKNFPSIWQEATPDEKQEFLRLLVKRVVVKKDGLVNVDLNI